MSQIYYLICYFCCCGCCCKQKFIKTSVNEEKTKTLKTLKDIKSKDKRRMTAETSDPLKTKTLEITNVHLIPDINLKSEKDVLASYGYAIGPEIGHGAFGTVHTAQHIKTGLTVAIKKITISEAIDSYSKKERIQRIKEIKNELHVLKTARHPHIIELLNHFMIKYLKTKHQVLYICMQFAPNGTLKDLALKYKHLNEDQCKIWFGQILSALSFMHSRGIAHRDLKPANILLDESHDVLVTDFGGSRYVFNDEQNETIESSTWIGTTPFMAPELLAKPKGRRKSKSFKYNALAVDVWSLGCVLYYIINTTYPFHKNKRESTAKVIRKMWEKNWDFEPNVEMSPSPQLRDILSKMLEPDPKMRPNVTELAKHEWIAEEYEKTEQKQKPDSKEDNLGKKTDIKFGTET